MLNRVFSIKALAGGVVWTALSILSAGCGRPVQVTELPPLEQNLQNLVMAYQQAATDLNRGPATWEELRPYVVEYGDPDAISRSPNDGEPFVIVWNIDLGKLEGAMPVVAHEARGKDGIRKAIDLRMGMRDLPKE